MLEVDHSTGLEWHLLLVDGDEALSIEADNELRVALLSVWSDTALGCELAAQHGREGGGLRIAEEVPYLYGAFSSEEFPACLMRKIEPIHAMCCSLFSVGWTPSVA